MLGARRRWRGMALLRGNGLDADGRSIVAVENHPAIRVRSRSDAHQVIIRGRSHCSP